jgi:hypothetical protein
MKYQHICYYKNTPNGFAYIDKELSSEGELNEEKQKLLLDYLENICKLKRHETKSTFFYTMITDSTHFSEYIFCK